MWFVISALTVSSRDHPLAAEAKFESPPWNEVAPPPVRQSRNHTPGWTTPFGRHSENAGPGREGYWA